MMDAAHWETQVEQEVARTAHALHQALSRDLSPLGVSCRQAQVLLLLRRYSELSQRQLARMLGIEPATLSGILDRMERDGLINRIRHKSDRRKSTIVVRSSCERLCKAASECVAALMNKAIAGIAPEELNALRKSLKSITDNLQ